MIETIVNGNDFMAHCLGCMCAHIQKTVLIGAVRRAEENMLSGTMSIIVILLLVLSLSGCDESPQVECVLEWECGDIELSGFLHKQGLFQYAEAQAYCRSLALDGKDDWRMPTRHELMIFPLQMQDKQREVVPLNSRTTTCWSSTSYRDSHLRYWAVSVSNKQAAPLKKETYNAVICVRETPK